MINSIKVWSRSGEEIASFQSTHHSNDMNNISLNNLKSFIGDTNRISGSAMHYGETLVVSVNDAEKKIVLEKLKEIFRDFKQTIL
jgi:hypothetical protein